eukprot:TRINITY_DN6406_c0_g1_i4.p2 TRINITY_DN6406_c0_g1~~TRINITY_DN6406_c0_g1_i4.p2  ORF type:complete len:262 (-),score=55.72 TRINITY_DN6406_c0_g1_i4:307-1092(-)
MESVLQHLKVDYDVEMKTNGSNIRFVSDKVYTNDLDYNIEKKNSSLTPLGQLEQEPNSEFLQAENFIELNQKQTDLVLHSVKQQTQSEKKTSYLETQGEQVSQGLGVGIASTPIESSLADTNTEKYQSQQQKEQIERKNMTQKQDFQIDDKVSQGEFAVEVQTPIESSKADTGTVANQFQQQQELKEKKDVIQKQDSSIEIDDIQVPKQEGTQTEDEVSGQVEETVVSEEDTVKVEQKKEDEEQQGTIIEGMQKFFGQLFK